MITFFELYVFILFPALMVAAVAVSEAIRRRVRSHHPNVWESLGRPGPLRAEKLGPLVTHRQYDELGDKRLSGLCVALTWVRRVFLVTGSAWLISLTYRRPLILGAIVLLVVITAALNRYAKTRRKGAV